MLSTSQKPLTIWPKVKGSPNYIDPTRRSRVEEVAVIKKDEETQYVTYHFPTKSTFSSELCNKSLNKYSEFTEEIKKRCMESAEKGNVHLVLTKKDLDELRFPIDKSNLKLLAMFLREQNLVVNIVEESRLESYSSNPGGTSNDLEIIELFWIDLVVSQKNIKVDSDVPEKTMSRDTKVEKILNNDMSSIVYTKEKSVIPSKKPVIHISKPVIEKPAYPKVSVWPGDDIDVHFIKTTTTAPTATASTVSTDKSAEVLGNVQSKFMPPAITPHSLLFVDDEVEKASEDSRVSDDSNKCQSDDYVFDIKVTTEDLDNIVNMTTFIKTMLLQYGSAKKNREKERIIYTMYLTILKAETDRPRMNDTIFKTRLFIDNLIDKLSDLITDGDTTWPIEMLVEFEEIKRNRFGYIPDLR
jgi:hypothetical protein